MEKITALLQSEHVEVTLRMGFTMFLGYSLAFFSFSDSVNSVSIVPIETHALLAILVPFCSMLFPTLTFTFGSVILPLLSVFILVFLSSTLLLAVAVVGGNGAFTAAFALVCFWITFFRFEKSEGNKTSLILIAIVFQTVLIYPTFSTVQNGITVPNPYLPPKMQDSLSALVTDAVQNAIARGDGTHMIDITTGTLTGQTAQVTVSNNSTETFIEGGMWIVRGMWTFTGTQNPLASYTNIMIFTCWLQLILALGVLMPPFRTMRSAVWRGIIPAAMKDAAQAIKLHVARMNHYENQANAGGQNMEEGNDEQQKEEGEQEQEPINKQEEYTSEKARLTTRGQCLYDVNALFGGTLAKYTAFEPRLLDYKPSEWTTAILVQLSSEVSRCVRIALGIELIIQMDDERKFLHKNNDEYLEVASTLEKCAKAMQTGNASILEEKEDNHDNNQSLLVSDNNNGETSEVEITSRNSHYDPFQLKKYAQKVVALTHRWLEAMNPTKSSDSKFFSSESQTAFWKNLYPWIFVQFSHFIFMASLIKNLFQQSSWQHLFDPSYKNTMTRLIWCVKYSIGMTLLMIFSIYWPAYKNDFVIASQDDPFRGAYAVQNGGWTIVAYCFATTQTVEGSMKKGILRMAGTVLGAFSGWLALLACEDENFTQRYNTYGLVAWLTITSFVATYVSTERGFVARISLSSDYAFGPIYFVLTEVIIISYAYFYFGPEGRDTITINRMVANLVGILLASILALIPPGLWGGDPVHCRSMVSFHWKSVTDVLRLVLSIPLIPNDGKPVQDFCVDAANELLKLREEILEQSSKMQELAVDFEKDASRLQKFPYFCVDPRLKLEIAQVTRDIHITAFIPMFAAGLLKDSNKCATLLGKESSGRKELEALLVEMACGVTTGCQKDRQELDIISSLSLSEGSTNAEVDVELLLRTIHWVKEEMYKHEEALNKIKWGV